MGIEIIESLSLWTYPYEHAVTVSNLLLNPGNSTPSQSQIKHGNLGKMRILSSSGVSRTCYTPKLRSGYNSRDGGKITEQANVRSNDLNIRKMTATCSHNPKAPIIGVLLNSVCLNEVVKARIVMRRKVRDLF